MMSNEKLHNNQIGLRIRTARKEKGINQTELANLLGKSLRTIQKYESGEIEVSIAMLNEIAKVLDCESTYLIGYDAERKPLEIKKIVGHSGAMTLTEKVYTHLDMQVLVDAINKTLENEDSVTADTKSA